VICRVAFDAVIKYMYYDNLCCLFVYNVPEEYSPIAPS
jgi:hypothetical protein